MPVVLLCHCDGTNGSTTFTDSSGLGRVLVATAVTVSTAAPKFGTGCADITTTGTASRSINAGPSPDFNLGAGQFTVEAWAYFTAGFTGVHTILGQWHASVGSLGWQFSCNSPTTIQFRYSTTGSNGITAATGSFSPTLNTWYHLAADRDATNTVRVYVNGAVVGSGAAAATIFAAPLNFMIGNDNSGADAPVAFIDDVRINKGTAVYAGAFTPPVAPFSNPTGAISSTNTSWNPTDKNASVGLANSNLTVACYANSQGVRAVNGQTSGKYYFEVTATIWTTLQGAIGIANASAVLATASATPTNAAVVGTTGTIYMNASIPPGSPSLGARANGDIIGVAVDVDNALIWFRVAPSGNWNGNAGFAPGGTGGVTFAAIGGGSTPVFPFVGEAFSGANFTANFGDTAFSGAVPAGFTPGWAMAAGGGVAASQARAMVLA